MKRAGIFLTVFLAASLVFSGCSRVRETDVTESASEEESSSESIPEFTVSQETEPPETEETEPEETEPREHDPETEKKILLGSDIHYLAPELTDYGEAFQYDVDHGDGRLVTYIDQITDAFLEEVVEHNPDILILCGDLSSNGELASHQGLAEKLRRVEARGIPVVVIPGNHDINNQRAYGYRGDEKYPVERTTPEQFREIYREFGYDEALSEDETTLSYVYQLDDMTRLLMLDTCQYREGNAKVGGLILTETYDWIEEQLEAAWEEGMNVIPVAHHNLLEESEVYTVDCTIEHSEQLAEILGEWNVNIFLSGHLHVQHWMEEEDHNLYEIVTGSMTTPDCRYGLLTYRDDCSFSYRTQVLDVESWAGKNGRTEEELLHFSEFSWPFLEQVFKNEAYGVLQHMEEITEEERLQMCEYYAWVNYMYYQGKAVEIRDLAYENDAYALWDSKGYITVLRDYVVSILEDADRDYNYLEVE